MEVVFFVTLSSDLWEEVKVMVMEKDSGSAKDTMLLRAGITTQSRWNAILVMGLSFRSFEI